MPSWTLAPYLISSLPSDHTLSHSTMVFWLILLNIYSNITYWPHLLFHPTTSNPFWPSNPYYHTCTLFQYYPYFYMSYSSPTHISRFYEPQFVATRPRQLSSTLEKWTPFTYRIDYDPLRTIHRDYKHRHQSVMSNSCCLWWWWRQYHHLWLHSSLWLFRSCSLLRSSLWLPC